MIDPQLRTFFLGDFERDDFVAEEAGRRGLRGFPLTCRRVRVLRLTAHAVLVSDVFGRHPHMALLERAP